MRKAAFALLITTALVCAQTTPDLKTAIDRSLDAMGSRNLKTLVISGEGWDGCVGQQWDPNSPTWRKFSNRDYVRSIDFDARAWRLERVRGEGENPGRGGCNAGPVFDQKQNQVTRLTPQSPWNTQMEFILLPEGFLKIALEKNAAVATRKIKGKQYTVISFMGDEKAPVTGYIDDMGYVEKVETKINNDVLGDIVWSATYSDWKDFGGVKFPTHIAQYQGPPQFFELHVSDVKPNAPVDLTVTARGGRGPGRGAGRGPGRGDAGPITEDLGGGFWLIKGGYASVIADFRNYIVVIEGPQSDARGRQIIEEAKKLVPNKPIRYVINTHAHFDHAGGLRPFIAEGATIVTSEANKAFYERVFKNAHTLAPDTLSKMNPQPKIRIETVGEKKIMTDGEHEIDIFHLQGSTHSVGMLIVYLPKQKALVEADEFNVGAANAPTPDPINPYHTNLLANIERLHLDVERIIPVHLPADDRKVTMAELERAAGK